MIRKLAEQGWSWSVESGCNSLDRLSEEAELALMKRLSAYPDVVSSAAANFEPHTIANYLRELAGEFHSYYNSNKVLESDEALRNARLALSVAVRQVIANGLNLLGVSAPEEM